MDPPTVSAACEVLITNITNVSKQISRCIARHRRARREMHAVSRSLSSLKLCLEILRDDSTQITHPESMHRNLIDIIGNCDVVAAEMLELLQKLCSDDVDGHIEWSAQRGDALRNQSSSLECYRSAIDIALDMSSITPVLSVPKQSEEHRSSAADTEHFMSQSPSNMPDSSELTNLVEELSVLRLQVSKVKQRDNSAGVLLERFLDESESYAKSGKEAESHIGFEQPLESYQPQPVLGEEDSERTLTSTASSRLDDERGKDLASDNGRSPVTDATSNASASETKPSSEASAKAEDGAREILHPGLSDIMNEWWGDTAKVPVKSVPRKPLPYSSAPELDLRGIQDAPQLDSAASNARVQFQDPTNQDLFRRSLPIEASCNPLPKIHRAPPRRDDPPLIPVETKPKRRKVEFAAIESAAIKWERLPLNRKLKLDKHFEVLIRGKKDLLHAKSFWLNEKVGSYEEIKKALDDGARPNSYWGKDKEGFPLDPLVTEMRNGKRREVIELLLSRGANPGNFDKILIAASCDYEVFAELLLDYGADVEARDRPNNSPLSYAAENGSYKTAKLLLDRGANVNARAGRFSTALQAASHQGSLSTVQHLLDLGADVNAQGGFYGNALQAACWWRHTMVVQLLLEDGADVNAVGQYGTALRAARVSNVPCGEERIRQTINLLIAYGAVDEKRADNDLEIHPMLPPRPSVSSASSGQSPVGHSARWA